MKNIIMTSLTLVACFAVGYATHDAQATHPNPSIMVDPFDKDDRNQTIFYDRHSLNNVNYYKDSTTHGKNLSGAIRIQAEIAREEIDKTNFGLTEINSFTPGVDNAVDAKVIGGSGVYALTETWGTGKSMYKFVYLNTNPSLTYTIYNVCNVASHHKIVSALFMFTHEFGHLAGLGHHSKYADNEHTAMKEGCNGGMSPLKAADIAEINAWYT